MWYVMMPGIDPEYWPENGWILAREKLILTTLVKVIGRKEVQAYIHAWNKIYYLLGLTFQCLFSLFLMDNTIYHTRYVLTENISEIKKRRSY